MAFNPDNKEGKATLKVSETKLPARSGAIGTPKPIPTPLHEKLRAFPYNTGTNQDVSPVLEGGGELRINDLIFFIPPTSIQIRGHDFNHKWETLRNSSSIKIRSGHGNLKIKISLVFTRDSLRGISSDQVISRSLIPLIDEFKRTPFCELENELLRRSLPVAREEAIGAALQALQIQTMPGIEGSLVCTLTFAWFNYKPFIPNLIYRKDWTNSRTRTERELYKQIGDTEYRVRRGSPAKMYNSLANKPTRSFIRSAPAMLHFRPDLIDPEGLLIEDDISLRKEGYRKAIDVTGDTTLFFWEVHPPSFPPPAAVERAFIQEEVAVETFDAVDVSTPPPEGGKQIVSWKYPTWHGKSRTWKSSAGTRDAFLRLTAAAQKEGIELWVVSAMRTNAHQRKLWNDHVAYLKRKYPTWSEAKIEAEARNGVAPPKGMIMKYTQSPSRGSKHEDATALDIIWKGAPSTYDSVKKKHTTISRVNNRRLYATKEFQWLENNAPSFGFKRLRTEAWHFNYIGQETARPAGDPTLADTRSYPGIPPKLRALIETYADKYGIPRPLAFGLVHKESGKIERGGRLVRLDPRATSRVGARGLTQVMPGTALWLRKGWTRNDLDSLYDPEISLDVGFGYLRRLIRKYSSYTLALYAYNWGPGNVDKFEIGAKRLPGQTRGYAAGIANFAETYYGGADIAKQIREDAIVEIGKGQPDAPGTTTPSVASGIGPKKVDPAATARVLKERREELIAYLTDAASTYGRDSDVAKVKMIREMQANLNGLTASMGEQDIRELYQTKAVQNAASGEAEESEAGELNRKLEGLIAESSSSLTRLWEERERPKGGGWKLVEDKVTKRKVFKRLRFFPMKADSKDMVVTSLSFNMANKLAPLPINGWRFPTIQYLGGRSTSGDISIAFVGETGRGKLAALLKMLHAYVRLSITQREFHKFLPIEIQNEMLNEFGLKQVLLEDWAVQTMPSLKDTVVLNLRFISNSADLKGGFSIPKTTGITDVSKELIQLLLERGKFGCTMRQQIDTTEQLDEAVKRRREKLDNGWMGIAGRGGVTQQQLDDTIRRNLKIAARSRRFLKTKSIPYGPDGKDTMLDDFATKLEEILNKHGQWIEHYPEIYGLGDYFKDNLIDAEPWPLSREKKNKAVYGGEVGLLDDFVRDINFFMEFEVLDALLWEKTDHDPEISAIVRRLDQVGKMRALPCYPDLNLPPNPITGEVFDTNPDFYFWNGSDVLHGNKDDPDSATGRMRKVYKDRGRQALMNSYESFFVEQTEKEDLTKTISRHPKYHRDDPKRRENLPIATDPVMLNLPSSNHRKTPVKGTWADVKNLDGSEDNLAYDHYSELGEDADFPEGQIKYDHDMTIGGALEVFDRYMDNQWTEEKLTMRRAYPTFKVFFIEEDQPGKVWKVFDDFYGLNSIQEIRIVRSRKIAADAALLKITNVSGTLNNRSFPEFSDEVKADLGANVTRALSELDDLTSGAKRATESLADLNNEQENPFESTILKEGTKIQIRLGYSNNYEELETVFNGQIVSVAGNEMLEVLCQSYATELVAIEKGTDPRKKFGWYNSDTDELLTYLISQPECKHFGRWLVTDIGLRPLHTDLRPDGSKHLRWGFTNTPADDNIFVEDWSSSEGFIGSVVAEYVLFHTTIWDVFKEMELRHPGWIASAVPYDDRMTMFFGVPCMEYFHRGPKSADEVRRSRLFKSTAFEEVQEELARRGYGMVRPSGRKYTAGDFTGLEASLNNPGVGMATSFLARDWSKLFSQLTMKVDKRVKSLAEKKAFSQMAERMNGEKSLGEVIVGDQIKSFRDYHFITSEHDIIKNNIRADHRGTFNSVTIQANNYPSGRQGFVYKMTGDWWLARWLSSSADNEQGVADYPVGPSVTISVDDHIRKDHLRQIVIPEPNCTGKEMAVRYGVGHLMRSLKDTYKGEVTILGDPKIKPHDVVYILDNYTDMSGPVEVEQVVHTLSPETGFITEITPDLCVTARRAALLATMDALQQAVSRAHDALLEFGGVATQAPTDVGRALVEGGAAGALGGVILGAGAFATTGWLALAGVAVSAVLLASGGMKFVQYATTREPITITPLIRSGKPFVSGFDGIEADGLITSIKGEWKHWAEDLGRAVSYMQLSTSVISKKLWNEVF